MLSAAHDILSQQERTDNSTAPTPGPALPSVRSHSHHPVLSWGNGSRNGSRYDCNPISTAAILLADVLPTMVIKFAAPFFINLLPYGWRVVLCVLTAAGSFLIVSFSTSVGMSILGNGDLVRCGDLIGGGDVTGGSDIRVVLREVLDQRSWSTCWVLWAQ